MNLLSRRAALAAPLALAMPAIARAQAAEVVVHYPMPAFFKDVMEKIAEEFQAANPGITVRHLAPSPSYEDAVQQVLRQGVAGGLPDVSFQGLNRLRMLVERRLPVDLAPFLAAEGDLAAKGWTPNLLGLGHAQGTQAGMAFASSNPVVYYNLNLVRRAGGDVENLPTDWNTLLGLAGRIAALGDGNSSMHYRWAGDDWMFSALLYGHGGRMLTEDEREVAFNGAEGRASMVLIDRMVKEGRMPAFTVDAALQAFYAGKMGIFSGTTAYIGSMLRSIGRDVELRTAKMPVIDAEKGRLPTGGNAGVILTREAARHAAAWKYLTFATGPRGQEIMTRGTGYVPCNTVAASDERYLGGFYRENPLYAPAMQQMPIAQPWYAFPGTNGVRITETIVNNIARVVEGNATPDVALAEMATGVRRLLPR
ncbi:ABC transporter substrate-binding protein [Plastoroseomonas arctica]|uniref:ABC transporter substrate-binding protein n=1 Tax=Plastoroseomonas arctica TaxID=1509237 RepID=A0AAF1JXF9_9PROT|nr:ABC transporter substrate-binding protein [Plastoroseomonas arctica]MBR0656131.1 ABC transporter substrate-binding protein [Plastoroseomonas arctica]